MYQIQSSSYFLQFTTNISTISKSILTYSQSVMSSLLTKTVTVNKSANDHHDTDHDDTDHDDTDHVIIVTVYNIISTRYM